MEYFNLIRNYKALVVIAVITVVYLIFKKKTGLNGSKKYYRTPTLDTYSVDYTALAKENKIDPVIGREEEVIRLAQILSRREKNNALLIGDPGVGKTAIVEGLAVRIIRNEVPGELKEKRVLALEVSGLLAGTKYRGEFEERAKKIIKEITNANRSIILFIDEVHSVIQSQGTEGAISLADILKPALARGELQMIGATTYAEYEKYFKTDSSLERRFQVVEINEPGERETLEILYGVKDKYKEYHQTEFTDAALHTAVKLTKEKIKHRKLPDKAIDAIDEAASMVKVADVEGTIHGVLHYAAVSKDPELGEVWRLIQNTDRELFKAKSKDKKAELRKQREELENKMREKGVLVVDSDDVVRVIEEWSKF